MYSGEGPLQRLMSTAIILLLHAAAGCLQGQVIENRLTAVPTAYPGLLEPGYGLYKEDWQVQ